MLRFRILKEIKKRLKRKRRPVWSLGALTALFLLAGLLDLRANSVIAPITIPSSILSDEEDPILFGGTRDHERLIRTFFQLDIENIQIIVNEHPPNKMVSVQETEIKHTSG
ncbi:MAG: hypothetical protein P0Y55_04760 [Candidatus Cohnella colombiensis]|uniref:Uncharacterized protein n=1 Tax=Candidatus Cohnella colombiensis TaxID=3121368 RepID=A0AA95JBG3_9BACL|nr:MAG: hypothetical protein P0Y55_04760 [Cohnella sp.]